MNRVAHIILAIVAIVCGVLALVGAKAFGAGSDEYLAIGLISAGVALLV